MTTIEGKTRPLASLNIYFQMSPVIIVWQESYLRVRGFGSFALTESMCDVSTATQKFFFFSTVLLMSHNDGSFSFQTRKNCTMSVSINPFV